MFKIGQKVKVLPHNRTRYIYNNAMVEPGKVTRHRGGKVGEISNVFVDTGQETYEVKTPGKIEDSYNEYSADELEAAE